MKTFKELRESVGTDDAKFTPDEMNTIKRYFASQKTKGLGYISMPSIHSNMATIQTEDGHFIDIVKKVVYSVERVGKKPVVATDLRSALSYTTLWRK